MPAVSCYLDEKVLNAVRAKAKAENLPVSRIISQAVEISLGLGQRKKARERVLENFRKKKPLGGMEEWNKLHKERTEADVCRH